MEQYNKCMKLDLSADEFAKLSGEQKKKYIANLFVQSSGAKPVDPLSTPVAVITAGLPGAGKTEFLDTLAKDMAGLRFNPPVRIDLDEIVGVYPDYTPKDYYKFRDRGNLVLERTIDVARRGRYNVFIDGTFSGSSGASVKGVARLLDAGYRVNLVYVYDEAKVAWMYTMKRRLETGRKVDLGGFKRSAKTLIDNLSDARKRFSKNSEFSISLVVQKELRDKDFYITTDNDEIDKFIKLRYNVDNLKDNDDQETH